MGLPDDETIIEFLHLYSYYRNSRKLLGSGNQEKVHEIPTTYHCHKIVSRKKLISTPNATHETTHPLEIQEIEQEHANALEKLKNETAFQELLKKNDTYKNSRKTLRDKKYQFISPATELIDCKICSCGNEATLRLQYLFACGILAYRNAEKMSESVAKEGFGRLMKSDKTTKAAIKLRQYLLEDGIESSTRLASQLDHLIQNRPTNIRNENIIFVTDHQRRRFMIRELALLGRREFMPIRSKNGRFFAQIVVDIASLFDPSIDLRTVNINMSPFDENKNYKGELITPALYSQMIQKKMSAERYKTFLEEAKKLKQLAPHLYE